MKYRLMDILACPICKHFHLELIVFQEKEYPKREVKEQIPLCEIYCSYRNMEVKKLENPPCQECIKKEVVEGILLCPACGRWYPIIDEIPRMLPDKLRKRDDDLKFLEKYKMKIPEKVLNEGLPYNIKG
ncbi:Trm112 family protein [Metallosphaera tengchongensis]|uniref:Trm112 family protein n=1 Tax=Metallosphaera tengchongensis TaxID=1532350 RepID=A0A6N0NXZ6_9CREN|nr:Trm112 family protein [Metallosphaera tengchongensis]QKQ99979.1 Trm112 family protein [Metallosphaera tengchongensis]